MSQDVIKPGDQIGYKKLNELGRRIPPRGSHGIIVRNTTTGTVIGLGGRREARRVVFFARIRPDPEADGENRWQYGWDEVYKNGTGYGGWSVRPADADFGQRARKSDATGYSLAYNFREDQNNGSGVEGNGVDVTALAQNFPGFELKPVPPNQIVLMYEVTLNDGQTKEWWFHDLNAIDGTCTP